MYIWMNFCTLQPPTQERALWKHAVGCIAPAKRSFYVNFLLNKKVSDPAGPTLILIILAFYRLIKFPKFERDVAKTNGKWRCSSVLYKRSKPVSIRFCDIGKVFNPKPR